MVHLARRSIDRTLGVGDALTRWLTGPNPSLGITKPHPEGQGGNEACDVMLQGLSFYPANNAVILGLMEVLSPRIRQ